MCLQSCRSPSWGNFGTPTWGPKTKNHLDVAPIESYKIYHKEGRWWLPPSAGYGESCVSELPVAYPSTKSVPTMHFCAHPFE
jgi:hypothetical protein